MRPCGKAGAQEGAVVAAVGADAAADVGVADPLLHDAGKRKSSTGSGPTEHALANMRAHRKRALNLRMQ